MALGSGVPPPRIFPFDTSEDDDVANVEVDGDVDEIGLVVSSTG